MYTFCFVTSLLLKMHFKAFITFFCSHKLVDEGYGSVDTFIIFIILTIQ